MINKITAGSIIVDSTVSLDDPTEKNAVASDFAQALSSGTETVDGYLIGGSATTSV